MDLKIHSRGHGLIYSLHGYQYSCLYSQLLLWRIYYLFIELIASTDKIIICERFVDFPLLNNKYISVSYVHSLSIYYKSKWNILHSEQDCLSNYVHYTSSNTVNNSPGTTNNCPRYFSFDYISSTQLLHLYKFYFYFSNVNI